ncbi:MAG: GTPase HflX [Chloroflexi bacterium]|nr:GTPase HflX [Chloroflexota bacterium]
MNKAGKKEKFYTPKSDKKFQEHERTILVGVFLPGEEEEEAMEELGRLAESAKANVVGTLIQHKDRLQPGTLLGKGKVAQLQEMAIGKNASLVIFNNDLKPMQERNLSKMLNRRVISRHALILDIFAQRARTKEGKIQVELAQLEYTLPRLAGLGIALSRLGGGIGTRGPGETMLETDRRHVLRRISKLRDELDKLEKHRNLLRRGRKERGYMIAALIGYTNAGKSTLLNSLTASGVLAEDMLFATLDPTTRKLMLPGNKEILLVDTVGLIRNLPHELVAAFHATLEELMDADILIHVMDSSHPRVREQVEVVHNVLKDLKSDNKPVLPVLNKVDLITPQRLDELLVDFPDAVVMSATKKIGKDEFLETLEDMRDALKRYVQPGPENDMYVYDNSGKFIPNKIQKESMGNFQAG